VTELEDQLRHELRTIADGAKPDSIRPLRVPPPRRRPRTVRWLAPVAAAAAVAGVIVAVTVAGHKTGQQPVSQLPAGTPKYYVTLNHTTPDVISAVVRSSVDGAPISSAPLLRQRGFTQPLAITAAANDRVFLITIPGALDLLRLKPDGDVLRLTRLPKKIWNLGGALGSSGADLLSPNGTEVVVPINRPLAQIPCPCRLGIGLVSLSTGVTTKWLWPSRDKIVLPLSWLDGRQVLLYTSPGGDRLLDVAGPGGSLLASSRPVHEPDSALTKTMVKDNWLNYPGESELLPGNKILFTAYSRAFAARHGGRTGKARFVGTSASTGALRRVLFTYTARVPSNFVAGCYLESLGPTGIHVLMSCLGRFGRLDGSHFTPLPGSSKDLEVAYGAAW
jgi:hypothetical protein